MLNKIKFDDPRFKSFIKQEITRTHKTNKQHDLSKEVIRRLKIQNKKLQENITQLKGQLAQLKTDKSETTLRLNQFIKLNNSLAGALGSCSNCWGEDPECSQCAGNGSPGWRSINRRLFNIFVLPVLERKYDLSGKIK